MHAHSVSATTSGLDGATVAILMPIFNDWIAVRHLIPKLVEVLDPLDVQVHIVLVDDGSVIETGREGIDQMIHRPIRSVDEISLTRNQGNQRAIAVGVGYVAENVPCDFLVVMDSDHEDQPDDVARLLIEGRRNDSKRIIFAERTTRTEGPLFRVLYHLYRLIFRVVTGHEVSFGNFCVVPRELMLRLSHVTDLWNQFPAAIIRSRLPFSKISTRRGRRFAGRSTMNLVSLVGHAFNGFSVFADVIAVRAIIASVAAGLVVACSSLVVLYLRLFTSLLALGWSSLALGIMLILLVQVISTSFLLSFSVALSRVQQPLIPARAYRNFIVDIVRHGGDDPITSPECTPRRERNSALQADQQVS